MSLAIQRVWICLLFTISCFSAGQSLKTIYYSLTQNQIQIWPKILSAHLMDFDARKKFREHLNSNCHTAAAQTSLSLTGYWVTEE